MAVQSVKGNLLYKTIFTQNGLGNFRLEVVKILVLLCRQFTVCTDTILKFQSKFSRDRSVYGPFHLKPLILDKIPTTFQAF